MAVATYLSTAAINAACDAVVDLVDAGAGAGLLRIYDGSRPANANTAVSGQTLLAELTFGDPAFGAASNGVATANAITADSSANNTGTASWCRIVDSDANVIMDGNVGTSDADLVLNTLSIVSGVQVSVSSLTYTHPDGT